MMKRYFRAEGVLWCIEHYNDAGRLHRSDGPAIITYSPDGAIDCLEWYTDGVPSRTTGPAVESFHEGAPQHEWRVNGAPITPTTHMLIAWHHARANNTAQENHHAAD